MTNPQQKQFNVILIGDDGVDEYHYGTVDRISPEAPIPIFCPKEIEYKKGMAANVETNLKNLGINVRSYFTQKSVKIRMIDQRSKQHILRVDHDVLCKEVSVDDIDMTVVDAIIISDYNKGTVSYELVEKLQHMTSVPIFVDTKKTDLARFNRCFLKINELEYSKRTSTSDHMIVTHGGSHVEYNGNSYTVPTVPVFDVCGAGDTFLAALVYEFLYTNDMNKAIEFAIKAAAVTVQHLGVYAPTIEEIK
jgi:D-beta-D-heptose 7-phosphate kinase/D-beta-D-heptose 1-phosphate adenosyltransferase